MGNCLRRDSSMVWGGEDWGSPADFNHDDDDHIENKNDYTSTSCTNYYGNNNNNCGTDKTSTEVKVKITKRQLEELLGKMDVRDMTVQQVLAQLISVGHNGYDQTQQVHSWRPVLQSIPEVN